MKRFDNSIRDFYRDLARISRRDPRLALHFTRTTLAQREAAARRRKAAKAGVQVPPFMILSVNQHCNLRSVLGGARDLGVSMVALAGEEPLTRPEIIDATADFPEMVFPLMTNAVLLDDTVLDKLGTVRNVIPVIRLEGLELETDARRDDGVYQQALDTMARLRERRIPFGTSVAVTRRNFGVVTSRRFVRNLVERGAKLFVYVDYVPVKAGTEHLIPSQKQRGLEPLTMMLLRSEFRAMFVASSASEQSYGGRMPAGRGFVHVSAEAAPHVAPCCGPDSSKTRRAA